MKNLKVVIAEENDTQRDKIKSAVSADENIELVGACKSGGELLEMITKNKPDAVVMDILLSGTDGFWVMEECAKLELKPKFLIMSSLSSETFVSKAMTLGAEYYMIKPINESILVSRIKDMCEGKTLPSKADSQEKTRALEEKISNIFITVGIPAHIKGYQFLREAIKLATQKPEIINSITKELYPSIANHFNTTASKVERAIRHAIEVAWNRGKIENINSVFGIKVYNNNEKPTNGEFIALVADKMLIEG